MHQLGVAKRAVQEFRSFVASRKGPKIEIAFHTIGFVGQHYGMRLTRQSDRDFPQTNFSSDITNASRREGNEFSGILLCYILAMLSDAGKEGLQSNARISATDINNQIEMLELILGMEDSFPPIHRDKGMGNVLIKNHLYFHVPKYISLWGPSAGWDSSYSESHHKTEIKAPSKNTQGNVALLIQQTAKRQMENQKLQYAAHVFGGVRDSVSPTTKQHNGPIAGSKFFIFEDKEGQPTMKWCASRKKKQTFLSRCCSLLLLQARHSNCF